MDFANTHAAEALAATESETARLRADLDRAVALLTANGIRFRETQNPAAPWMRPMDNYLAVAARNEAEARFAAEMEDLCGPVAFHRNAMAGAAEA